MSGNSIGTIFKVTTFGESHGEAMGVVIDGMPPNIEICSKDLQKILEKRRPGRMNVSTSRNEQDQAHILSGIFENKTLGTPISVIVKNADQRSGDYNKLKESFRPGHADKTTIEKFGVRDHRGGGRASGRETVSRVIAGYFAGLVIPKIKVCSIISQIGPHVFQLNYDSDSKIGLADSSKDSEITDYLLSLKKTGESAGGEIKVRIQGVPAGLGDPCFDKLKATLSHALISIGTCMGISFGYGDGFKSTLGSEIAVNPRVFGGIEGGISNGDDIYLSLIFKAPSTVGEKAKEGRHDPCILPRVIPVVDAMIKIVLCDHTLIQKTIK
jgi:chorismate synthase